MVDSSISESERRYWNRVLGIGLVLLVGASSGLIALQGGASLVEIGAVSLVGTAMGALLLWYLVRVRRQYSPGRR